MRRVILDFPDYTITDEGEVERITGQSRGTTIKQRVLRDSPYFCVGLWRDGKGYTRFVHSLVLEAFVSPRPTGMESCHVDGVPTNNSAQNLYWGTAKQNATDRMRHGHTAHGSQTGYRKLNESQVREIRRFRQSGRSSISLAKQFNISRRAIDRIMDGTHWAWLK